MDHQGPEGTLQGRLRDHRPRADHRQPPVGGIGRFATGLVDLGTEVAKRPVAGAIPLELHHDQGTGRPGLLGTSLRLTLHGLLPHLLGAAGSKDTLCQARTAGHLVLALNPAPCPEHRPVPPVRQFPEIGRHRVVQERNHLPQFHPGVPARNPAHPDFPQVLGQGIGPVGGVGKGHQSPGIVPPGIGRLLRQGGRHSGKRGSAPEDHRQTAAPQDRPYQEENGRRPELFLPKSPANPQKDAYPVYGVLTKADVTREKGSWFNSIPHRPVTHASYPLPG